MEADIKRLDPSEVRCDACGGRTEHHGTAVLEIKEPPNDVLSVGVDLFSCEDGCGGWNETLGRWRPYNFARQNDELTLALLPPSLRALDPDLGR